MCAKRSTRTGEGDPLIMSDSHPAEAPKESAARGPADDYFETKAPTVWDIVDFLDEHKLDCAAEKLSHSWKEALSRITKATSATGEMKEKANSLLNKWPSRDRERFRVWRDGSPHKQPVPPSINIQNLKNLERCSVSINIAGDAGKDPIAAKGQTKKRKAVGHAPSKSKKKKRRAKACEPGDAAKRLSLFQKRLNDIEKLWYLDPDKSSVEHRLAQYVESHNEQETPAHSLILDTDDEDIRILFEDDEWGQIMELVPQLPDTDAVLKNYLDLFRSKETVDEIKDILERGAFFTVADKALDGSKRRTTFRNLEWAHLVLSWLVCDYANGHIALPDNREKWYQTHVWTAFFDRLFESIPDIRILSGECPTDATASRKNPKTPPPGTRRNPGYLHDAVIKYCEFEIGAVENGGCCTKPEASKWAEDTMKLFKVSRDMIVTLYKQFGKDVYKVPIVGLVTGALHFKTYYTVYGGGSVCVLSGNKPIKLPTKIQHFGSFAAALLYLWQVRVILEQTTKTLNYLENNSFFNDTRRTPGLIGSIETDPPTDNSSDVDPDRQR